MSLLTFSAVILAYICVLRILVCPIIFDRVSIGTPFERQMVVA